MGDIFMHNQDLIEPHKTMLIQPTRNIKLYKVTDLDFLLKMLDKNFLYFSRVDSYKDDPSDSDQFPKHKKINQKIKFAPDNNISYFEYLKTQRKKIFTLSFSYIYSQLFIDRYCHKYAKPVCLVFNHDKFRQFLNNHHATTKVYYSNHCCEQNLLINYGIIDYIDIQKSVLHQGDFLITPIEYTYKKDIKKFKFENEFRVSLWDFYSTDTSEITKHKCIRYGFNFKKAISFGAIEKVIVLKGLKKGIKHLQAYFGQDKIEFN